MRKFQCLLFVLKQSYICYYIIHVTVPLICCNIFSSGVLGLISDPAIVLLSHISVFGVLMRYLDVSLKSYLPQCG